MNFDIECEIVCLFVDDFCVLYFIQNFVNYGVVVCGKYFGEWFGLFVMVWCIQYVIFFWMEIWF